MAGRHGATGCCASIVCCLFTERKNCLRCSLQDNWLHDLQRQWQDDMTQELIQLSVLLEQIVLNPSVSDSITWKLTNDGLYTSSSAYHFQFEGMVKSDIYSTVWRSWAPAKCKLFLWMAMQHKILTADVLLRRGWENNYFFPLCMHCLETAVHLLSECSWSRKVWEAIATMVGQ